MTSFYRGSDCCVIVYDVTSRESFQHLEKWKNEFIEGANIIDAKSIPIYIVGNKCDCEPEKRQVSEQEAKEWCSLNGHVYFETSALNSNNIGDLFNALTGEVVSSREEEDQPENPATITLQNAQVQPQPNQKDGCC